MDGWMKKGKREPVTTDRWVEDIECLDGCFSSLLITKDEINPIVETA